MKFSWNFEQLEKKIPFTENISPTLGTVKNATRKVSKKSRSRRPFKKQHGKLSQTMFKSVRNHLYHIYWSLWRKVGQKMSLLVICKILQLFANTLSTDDKYSLLKRDNLSQPIQMELSKKQNNFSRIFSAFFKSISNFEHSFKKIWPS